MHFMEDKRRTGTFGVPVTGYDCVYLLSLVHSGRRGVAFGDDLRLLRLDVFPHLGGDRDEPRMVERLSHSEAFIRIDHEKPAWAHWILKSGKVDLGLDRLGFAG